MALEMRNNIERVHGKMSVLEFQKSEHVQNKII